MESKHHLEQVSATAGLRGTLLERPVEQGGLTLELISGLTLGWRLLSNPFDLTSELDIKAIRREQDDNNPRHSVGAEWKLNW